MPNPEIVQSAGNIIHQILEARDVLTDANFLHMLRDIGHPYGLMLGQLSQTPSSRDVITSSQLLSDRKTYLESSQSLSEIWTSSLEFSQLYDYCSSYFGSLHKMAHGLTLYSLGQESSMIEYLSEGISSSGSSILIFELSEYHGTTPQTGTGGGGRYGIGLGTVSLNLSRYKGQEPFVVKTPAGEPVTEIQPGSPLAFLHLNRQASEMRKMSPLERIQTMTQDLKKVFSLIDNPASLDGLKPEQQAVLTAARSAVIVGISHLVPIFHKITDFPTWKLDVLPLAVRNFHRFDSQAVSKQFGGHRQVKVEDIEMTVITPQMRQQLVATTL